MKNMLRDITDERHTQASEILMDLMSESGKVVRLIELKRALKPLNAGFSRSYEALKQLVYDNGMTLTHERADRDKHIIW